MAGPLVGFQAHGTAVGGYLQDQAVAFSQLEVAR
jgi:hypothetical protein